MRRMMIFTLDAGMTQAPLRQGVHCAWGYIGGGARADLRQTRRSACRVLNILATGTLIADPQRRTSADAWMRHGSGTGSTESPLADG